MNKFIILTATITSSFFILGCNKNNNSNNTTNKDTNSINQEIGIAQHIHKPKTYETTADGLNYFDRYKAYYSNEFYKKNYLNLGKWSNLKKYSSNQIFKDYQDNEVGANLKYATPFSITGKARSFSSGIGDMPSIHFDVGNHFNGVTAIFSKNQSQFIGKLKKGESIELWCTHSKDFGSSAVLHNCLTPEEIQITKNEKLSSDLNLFLQGNNPSPYIPNEILYAIIMNEKKHPFISCKNNDDECFYNETLDNPKTKKQLTFETSLIELYAVAKVAHLTKTIYGDDLLKKMYLGDQTDFKSAKDAEEFIKFKDNPLQPYKQLIESNKETYQNSKVLQKMELEKSKIENFQY